MTSRPIPTPVRAEGVDPEQIPTEETSGEKEPDQIEPAELSVSKPGEVKPKSKTRQLTR